MLLSLGSRKESELQTPVVSEPFYVEPFDCTATLPKLTLPLDTAEAFDRKIGPRSPDQEIASEFTTTFYSGGMVTINGIAGRESYWGNLWAATIRFQDQRDHVDISARTSASDCPSCNEMLDMRTGADPEWKDSVLGSKVTVTGEIWRRYKPSIDQRARMWRRAHPQSSFDGVGPAYRGGYYTYSIVPTRIQIRH